MNAGKIIVTAVLICIVAITVFHFIHYFLYCRYKGIPDKSHCAVCGHNRICRKYHNTGIFHRVIRMIIAAAACVLVFFIFYFAYLIFTYHRLPDHLKLTVNKTSDSGDEETGKLQTGKDYTALTYNIGFGAYTPDYSFFMDGGKYSWAKSRESVYADIAGAGTLMGSYDPDFAFIEEIDTDSTRSYHVNERSILDRYFPAFYRIDAVDYDSAFLIFPLYQPHGFCRAQMSMYSRYPVISAERRSFPISQGLTRFLDLDRCYSVSKIPAENGHELCLYMLHMSAYGSDDSIRKAQVAMLCDDMESDINEGNYVICGGDFNHDLKAEWGKQGEVSWACPFPKQDLPDGLSFYIDTIPEKEKAAMPDSARNDDIPYTKGVTYTVTLDGFIISDNIKVDSYEVVDNEFQFSDHEPVVMSFMLK